MKTSDVVLIAIFFLIIGILISDLYIKSTRVCYNLPKHGSTDEWGPLYWKSLHSIVGKIPCSLCRDEASEMMQFIHDKINLKLGKKLYNEDNFYKWVDKISELKK